MTPRSMNLKSTSLILFISLTLVLAPGTDAIVKQQRSDDGGQQGASSVSSSVSVSTSSSSSSPSVGSSSSQSSQGISSQPSNGYAGLQNQASNGPASGQSVSMQQASQSASYPSFKQQVASYVDSLNAAANAPDSSYQVAAQNVNMALANSGIFGSSGYSQGQQQASQSQASAGQQLNPLHYYYYPAKESGQNSVAPKSANGASSTGQQYDMMANAASTNYQTGYPTYADQMGSMQQAPAVDAAASSQDPSYLPQPGADQGLLYSNNQQQAQQPQQHQQQPQLQSQQQQQPQHVAQQYNGDLMGAYSNNQQPQQQPQQSAGSVTFQGPSSGAPSQQQQQQQSQPDFMSSFQGNGVYANQIGDLSTSNFGNNAGGLSSVASYMSPGQSASSSVGQQQQGSQSQHGDLFGAAAALQGFSSAASQLTGAVSPPGPQSMFSSNMFSQPSQQQAINSNGQLFSGQQYLNQFLTPDQIRQLTGGSLDGSGQLQAAASSPVTSVASPSGSSKRFGIGSFIMPMLALAGLSLLIPTMSNLGTAVAGRKKRSISEERASGASRRQQIVHEPANGLSAGGQLEKEMSIGEYMDRIERYYSIYKDAVENEECLNRLICEFGDAVKDVNGKTIVVTVIEKLVPNWMTGKVHLFKEAALNSKEGKEKCQKYICSSGSQQNRKH